MGEENIRWILVLAIIFVIILWAMMFAVDVVTLEYGKASRDLSLVVTWALVMALIIRK